jgi:hypothetical protein
MFRTLRRHHQANLQELNLSTPIVFSNMDPYYYNLFYYCMYLLDYI